MEFPGLAWDGAARADSSISQHVKSGLATPKQLQIRLVYSAISGSATHLYAAAPEAAPPNINNDPDTTPVLPPITSPIQDGLGVDTPGTGQEYPQMTPFPPGRAPHAIPPESVAQVQLELATMG